MSDRNNNGLYFIVGGLVVVVALLFFFMSGGDADMPATGGGDNTEVNVDAGGSEPAATPDVSVEADSPEPAN
ncbi:hypothetical protein Q4511_11685 [Paracoccus sp. 1_MG-2023]|uniref:hypothetical protein n=1 Tax=unclassified Paracoccus (in: a-proteobacteria) TaxID=2688777 RepID=UPI001C09088A|nr:MULTISPECIES: hypothetical protein [unclassified Paracoccus (in: a-proteobacteria)]MBU2957082.1 hypothetical protein [Paracoccus sp. C2R09]MDO6669584.1 hypothetical protein [Paracoccus sp. 1_MG-2023]